MIHSTVARSVSILLNQSHHQYSRRAENKDTAPTAFEKTVYSYDSSSDLGFTHHYVVNICGVRQLQHISSRSY